MTFKGKVVIVTGASSGIGAATAVMFSKEGAQVVMVGRNEAKLNDVEKKCASVGSAPLVIKADVSVDNDAKKIISETIKKYGTLDILVNNAGFVVYGSLLDGRMMESYDKVMAVNLRAVVHLTILAAPYLIKTKGNIVNISSIAGQASIVPSSMAYCTSKAGLDHFSRGCALELAASGVRVNTISPGPVQTDILENAGGPIPDHIDSLLITPLGRISHSDEIAQLILFLASDKSVGITGSTFVSDNGCLLKM